MLELISHANTGREKFVDLHVNDYINICLNRVSNRVYNAIYYFNITTNVFDLVYNSNIFNLPTFFKRGWGITKKKA